MNPLVYAFIGIKVKGFKINNPFLGSITIEAKGTEPFFFQKKNCSKIWSENIPLQTQNGLI